MLPCPYLWTIISPPVNKDKLHLEAKQIELEASPQDGLLIDDAPAEQEETGRGWLREVVETLLLAVIIWLAVNTATARFVVEGPSMEPNFHTGEFVLVSRTAYWKVFGEPQRGDVIVLHPPTKPGEEFIKRLVGLPGDRVEVRDGQVFVNDVLLDEPYIEVPTNSSGVWNVGEDQYFVMGDNRRNSEDSRSWGENQLHRDMIIGRAWLIYWPPRDWRLVQHQTYVSPATAVVDAAQPAVPTATVVPAPLVVQEPVEDTVEPAAAPPVTAESVVETQPPQDNPVGVIVTVSGTLGEGLLVREGAGTTYKPRFVADEGDSLRVEAGPRESDGYVWWYLVDPDIPQNYGWAAGDFLSGLPQAGTP